MIEALPPKDSPKPLSAEEKVEAWTDEVWDIVRSFGGYSTPPTKEQMSQYANTANDVAQRIRAEHHGTLSNLLGAQLYILYNYIVQHGLTDKTPELKTLVEEKIPRAKDI